MYLGSTTNKGVVKMKRKRLKQLKMCIENQLNKGVPVGLLEVSEDILPCNYRIEIYNDYIEFETQFTQVFKGRVTRNERAIFEGKILQSEKQGKIIPNDNNNYLEFRIVGKKFEVYLILDSPKSNFRGERDYIKLNI